MTSKWQWGGSGRERARDTETRGRVAVSERVSERVSELVREGGREE